jgi:hypothetical protein
MKSECVSGKARGGEGLGLEQMSIKIDGEIVPGLGGAHAALGLQIVHLTSRFPALVGIHPGTINIQLDQPLRILNPDFESPIIHAAGAPVGEKFGFLEITFESPLGGAPRTAWIYMPHNSPHFHNVFHIEVVTNFISDGTATAKGTRCRIHIDKPHRKEDLIVVWAPLLVATLTRRYRVALGLAVGAGAVFASMTCRCASPSRHLPRHHTPDDYWGPHSQ